MDKAPLKDRLDGYKKLIALALALLGALAKANAWLEVPDIFFTAILTYIPSQAVSDAFSKWRMKGVSE